MARQLEVHTTVGVLVHILGTGEGSTVDVKKYVEVYVRSANSRKTSSQATEAY